MDKLIESMHLIAQSVGRYDVALCHPEYSDFAIGENENDFEVLMDYQEYKRLIADSPTASLNYLYYEGTEYGGIIDTITFESASETVRLNGRTWQGVLNTRIIKPDAGQAYYTVSGSIGEILQAVIDRVGLTEVFEIGECSPTVTEWTFGRYEQAYDGLRKFCRRKGLKLVFTDDGSRVILQAYAHGVYKDVDDLSTAMVDMTATMPAQPSQRVYMVCLGAGTLQDRLVAYLRLDMNTGNIDQVAVYEPNAYSYEVVLDYPNAEDVSELVEKGRERLEKIYLKATAIKAQLHEGSLNYDIGDLVGATDEQIGITVSAYVAKKILYVNEYGVRIECKIGG